MIRNHAVNQPVWEIATLFPPQGQWSIEEYLALEARANRLVEFSHGNIDVLPMPSIWHQRLVRTLFHLLFLSVQQHRLGEVFFAPTRVALWEGKVREPDVFFVANDHVAQHTSQWFERIDLVMEVVSPDDPERDLATKRREYAQAGIPEYWIVDPRSRQVSVLTLDGATYRAHGVFGAGEVATSLLLNRFAVDVGALFAEPDTPTDSRP